MNSTNCPLSALVDHNDTDVIIASAQVEVDQSPGFRESVLLLRLEAQHLCNQSFCLSNHSRAISQIDASHMSSQAINRHDRTLACTMSQRTRPRRPDRAIMAKKEPLRWQSICLKTAFSCNEPDQD